MKVRIKGIPKRQMGGQDCPPGYAIDETGQCSPDNGFNPSQYNMKGMPIANPGAIPNAQGFQNANPAPPPLPKQRNPFDWNKFADITGSIGNNLTNFIGGAGAIADVFSNQQDIRSQNKWIRQQMMNTNAINPIRDRGDYDVNTGVFRPDQYVANKGMYTNKFYSAFGGPIFQDGGSFYNPIGDGLDPSYSVNSPILVPPSYSASMPAPTAPASYEPFGSTASGNFRDEISKKESSGNYKALPWMDKKHTKLASSAAGKYQFLWNKHKDWIGNVTGVKSKSDFLNNPEAQEKAFDYWDSNTLTPEANRIKKELNLNVPLDKIKYAIHFSGPAGAYKYFKSGELTKDAFGSTTKSYAKLKMGGENTNTMKIRIVKNPGQYMANGGETYGSQKDYGLYLNQKSIYNTPDGPYSNPGSTVSEDDNATPEEFVLEAEGGEHIAYPDGSKLKITGKDHSQGGEKLTGDQAPQGSFIYSKTKAMRIKDPEVLAHFGMPLSKKITPAKIAAKYNVNKFKAVLDDPNADKLEQKTSKLMFEGWNKKLAELALIQEAMKGFPNGIPDKAKSLMPEGEFPQEAPMTSAKYGGGMPTYQVGAQVNHVTAGNINDIGGVGNMVAGKNIKTWPGDQIENKDNYSRMLPAEIAAKAKALGYSGPLDTSSIMQWLYNSSPENRKVIDDLHVLHPGNKGGVFNNVNGKPTYKWGYRWDMALNKMRVPGKPQDTPPVVNPVSTPTPTKPHDVIPEQPQSPQDNPGPVPPNINPAQAAKQKGIGQLPFFSYDMFVAPQQEKVYAAPLHAEIPTPTFYDPTRQLAQNSENASMLANVIGQFAPGQSLGSRVSSLQGKLAEEQANTISTNNNLNVGVANQFAPLQAGIINHENEYNADRADKLFFNQEQTKKDYRNQLRNWFGKAGHLAKNNYDIRTKTKMLNTVNPYFNMSFGPTSANMNFNPGVDAFGQITGQYNTPGATGVKTPTPEQYAAQMQSWSNQYPGLEKAALQNMWNMKYPGQTKAARNNSMQQFMQMAMQNQGMTDGYDVNSLWDQ